MPSGEGKGPKLLLYNGGYNGTAKVKTERARAQIKPRGPTLRAFEELEMIRNWAEFVAVCDEQKRKRGGW
jgi:hypothetical protein